MTQNREDITVEHDGQTYKIGFCGWSLWSEAEEELRQRMRNEFDQAFDKLPQLNGNESRSLLLGAFDSRRQSAIIPKGEVDSWLVSPSGTEWLFWKCLQVHNPEMSRERARQIYDGMSADEYERVDVFLVRRVTGDRFADRLESLLEQSRADASEQDDDNDAGQSDAQVENEA